MDTVYLVIYEIRYQGSSVEGVFSSPEKAKTKVEDLLQEHANSRFCAIPLDSWEYDDDTWTSDASEYTIVPFKVQ